MHKWIETIDTIPSGIGRTYQEGLNLGSVILSALGDGLVVDLSFLNIQWLTVDFVAGLQNSLNGSYKGIKFHYMKDAVRTILGGQDVHSNSDPRRSVQSQRIDPRSGGQNVGGSSGKVDISGG